MESIVNFICTTQLNFATCTLIVSAERISSQSEAKNIKPKFIHRNPIIAYTCYTIVNAAQHYNLTADFMSDASNNNQSIGIFR